MMEFLSTEQEDLPLPSQEDYEQAGFRVSAQTLRASAPPSRPLAVAAPAGAAGSPPNLQYFGPKDFVPEVPHLVPRDFNGLEMRLEAHLPASRIESRIDEDYPAGGAFCGDGQQPAVRPSEYLQLVPKPR